MRRHGVAVIWLIFGGGLPWVSQVNAADRTSPIKPHVIELDFFASDDSRGGVVTADLDSDGRMDFVVTAPGHIGGYQADGRCFWHLRDDVRVSAGSSERVGLPGHHAPGVQVECVHFH